LPHETNYNLVYGAPAATTLAFLLAGILLVWYMRRKPPGLDQSGA
jgi:Na+-driven multidrug efflux pump